MPSSGHFQIPPINLVILIQLFVRAHARMGDRALRIKHVLVLPPGQEILAVPVCEWYRFAIP